MSYRSRSASSISRTPRLWNLIKKSRCQGVEYFCTHLPFVADNNSTFWSHCLAAQFRTCQDGLPLRLSHKTMLQDCIPNFIRRFLQTGSRSLDRWRSPDCKWESNEGRRQRLAWLSWASAVGKDVPVCQFPLDGAHPSKSFPEQMLGQQK